MPFTIFFSWQSDRKKAGEQTFIEHALESALKRITADATVEAAIRDEVIEIDRDTKGVGGMPPIVDTIFAKIDRAAIFVPDLTFVSVRPDGRPAPNPNVLIEYGWALKSRSHARVMPVMNTHYGTPTPENMPFDMRHLRFPIGFDLAPDADSDRRRAVGDKLSQELESAVRAILQNVGVQNAAPDVPFPRHLNTSTRFRPGKSIGKDYPVLGQPSRDIFLANGAAMSLRLMPSKEIGRRWSPAELKKLATAPAVRLDPLTAFGRGSYGISNLRGPDGFGTFIEMNGPTASLTYVFETGEIWAIDTYSPNANGAIFLPIPNFIAALDQYRAFLRDQLKIESPYSCVATIDGVANRKVWLQDRPGKYYIENPAGSFVGPGLSFEVSITESSDSREALRGFFQRILEACGIDSPGLLDAQ